MISLTKWCYDAEGGRLRHRSSLVFPRYVRMAAGLLRDGLRREMWTAVRLVDGSTFRLEGTMGYGMGWIVDDRAGHRSVGHSGGCTVVTRTRTRCRRHRADPAT